MTASVTVIGALGSAIAIHGDADAVPERQPVGAAVELAVCLARHGLDVVFVGAVDEPVDAALRAPLVAEGVELVVVEGRDEAAHAPEVVDAATEPDEGLSHEWSEALLHLRRRDALVVVPDLPSAVLRAVLDPQGRLADHRTAVIARPLDVEPSALAHLDLCVADLAAARRLVGEEDEVPARGVARRLLAFGPKRVLVLDRSRHGRSVHFDGIDVQPVDFAGESAEGSGRATVFAAAFVAARVGAGARAVAALAEGTRWAARPDAGEGPFAGLPSASEAEGADSDGS